MKAIASFVSLCAFALLTFANFDIRSAQADTFGSQTNTFNIDFVTIGNPGNAANDMSRGSVSYTYNIGKYEISRDMIRKANASIESGGGHLALFMSSLASFGGNGADRPASGLSWNEAARFVNWLNVSHGFHAAYKFTRQPGDVGYNPNVDPFINIQLWTPSDTGYNPNNLFRNSLAHYFLPSIDEWQKAAYYNPTGGNYFDYPTGSNTAPTPVTSGTAAGTAVFYNQSGPADVTLAGGLSPYGTMAQGGNMLEWVESEGVENNDPVGARLLPGGDWVLDAFTLHRSFMDQFHPGQKSPGAGFRVASIPEPASLTLSVAGMMALLLWRGRK